MSKYHPEVDGPRPQCFSPVGWLDWQTAERIDSLQKGYTANPSGYCSECSKAYQARMIQHGACAYPGTIFAHDEALEQEVGIRPLDKQLTSE